MIVIRVRGGTKPGGGRWQHMTNYWIPAVIVLSWIVFVFAMREPIGPKTIRIRAKMRERVTKRRALRLAAKSEPAA
jgi:hypothetical protein